MGLIVIGIASLLAGIGILAAAIELFVGATRFADWTRPSVLGNDVVQAQVYPEHYLLIGAILLIPALILLGLPIGIARQRPWAGIIGAVVGGLIAMYWVLALVIPSDEAATAERWHPGASLPWVLLGTVLLWYFNRRSIKRDLGMGDLVF